MASVTPLRAERRFPKAKFDGLFPALHVFTFIVGCWASENLLLGPRQAAFRHEFRTISPDRLQRLVERLAQVTREEIWVTAIAGISAVAIATLLLFVVFQLWKKPIPFTSLAVQLAPVLSIMGAGLVIGALLIHVGIIHFRSVLSITPCLGLSTFLELPDVPFQLNYLGRLLNFFVFLSLFFAYWRLVRISTLPHRHLIAAIAIVTLAIAGGYMSYVQYNEVIHPGTYTGRFVVAGR